MNSLMRKCFFGILLGYGIMLCGLFYWHLFADLGEHPANPRYYLVFSQPRGSFLDRNGFVLAASEVMEDGTRARKYTIPSLSHVIGYFHSRYGITGLEKTYHSGLMGGQTVWTTIDLGIQRLVEEAFAGYTGAVIVIKPSTGEVLALLSSPYLDGNQLDKKWTTYREDVRSPFLNRVTQGLYPPGSAVKPIVYGTALIEDVARAEQLWVDKGVVQLVDREIANYGALPLGTLTTEEALAQSSNVVFAQLAAALGTRLLSAYDRCGLGRALPFDLPNRGGYLPDQAYSDYGYAQLGIGQGELLVTPLQMGVLVAAIANRGTMMAPYLIRELRGGFRLRQITRPRSLGQVLPERTAILVRDAMVLAVQNGTAQTANITGVSVAAKTGTAQNPHGQDHAWFIGFAPSIDPQLAIAVVVEQGGVGGTTAAPIGGTILKGALDILNRQER